MYWSPKSSERSWTSNPDERKRCASDPGLKYEQCSY